MMSEKGGIRIMLGLLIADKDAANRKQIANLLIDAGYDVMVTDSAAKAINGVLKKTARVVLLGTELDEFTSAVLVPLLKQCNRKLMIILIADDAPLPLIRKVRKEGIFYHALRPAEPEDEEEIRQVVKCAMESLTRTDYARKSRSN
jgi:DNA-binding NtrC family response regulator